MQFFIGDTRALDLFFDILRQSHYINYTLRWNRSRKLNHLPTQTVTRRNNRLDTVQSIAKVEEGEFSGLRTRGCDVDADEYFGAV